MPTTEHDSALMAHAAIEVGKEGGLANLPVALPEPLPEEQRRYFYTVSDEHPSSKVYGASSLSAILAETRTPHLADRNRRGATAGRPARYGLRYGDRAAVLDRRLAPFVSDDAKRAWRSEAEERRREQRSVVGLAQSLRGLPDMAAVKARLPAPVEAEEGLHENPTSAISTPRTSGPPRDNSR